MLKSTFSLIFFVFLISVSICFSSVPESTWKAVVDQNVILEMNDAQIISCRVIDYDGSTVTISKKDGYVESVDADKVNRIRIDNEQLIQIRDKPVNRSFKKEKTWGPFIGFGPGIIGINADINDLNLFASGSLIFPIASEGEYFAFSIGAGKLIKIGNRGWKFNMFSNLSYFSMNVNECYYSGYYDCDDYRENDFALGVGIGFQYITQKGILFSFKLPVLGYTFGNGDYGGFGVLTYYPFSGASLPAIVFGKSF